MGKKSHFQLSLYVLLIFTSAFAGAGGSPSWRYRVLQTSHFEIIFREEQRDLAKRYALAAEQAYEVLIPIFKEAPSKTIIFLDDSTDMANGMATFLPYRMIGVNPVLPGTFSSIDDYGDWPFEMILHEYTHILNMYPVHGFYIPLRWIFGSLAHPNGLLPKWYVEGLAVNTESRLSDHGRLRSTDTEGDLRALVLDSRLKKETIATINEQELSTWPFGNRPYLFGGWWWKDAQDAGGVAVIESWNQSFSRRIPFLLNAPMREKTGKTAHEQLVDTQIRLENRAQEEIKILSATDPQAKTSNVVSESGEQRIFSVSASGDKLVYLNGKTTFGTNNPGGTSVMLKLRDRAQQPFNEIPGKFLFKTVGTERIRWLDDHHLLFDQLDIDHPYVTFRDLYIYDLASEKKIRLTRELRAQEPTTSPSGDKVAFIINDGGRNHLALLNLENFAARRAPVMLAHSNLQQRLSGPEFINEDEIVFSLRTRSGEERLQVINLKDNKIRLWNSSLKAAQNPRWTTKGLLVSDSRTGVRNIYLAQAGESAPQALTNTLTHIEFVDFDPQREELLISELTGEGDKLRTLPLKTYKPASIALPKFDPPPTPQTTKIKMSEESYQPLEYLLPHYWIPFVYSVEGGLLFQGITANNDPVGRNHYALAASFDTVTQKPAYGINYVNNSTPVGIGMSYAKAISYLGASQLTLESQSAGMDFTTTWPALSRNFSWRMGGLWSDVNGPTLGFKRLGPLAAISYSRMNSPLNSRFGYLAELAHQQYVEQTGYLAYARTYAHTALSVPVWSGHKILLNARGALAPDLPDRAIVSLGDRNLGGNYAVNLVNSDFLLRGYPSGAFVGRKALNANLEYFLPVKELAKGAGTFPIFLKQLEMVGFVDAMSVDGRAWDNSAKGYLRTDLSTYFLGTGAELRLSTTAGYHLPMTLILGGYYGFNGRFGGGLTPFFGFSWGELGGANH